VGGWGESQFRRGAYTVVLFICTYFVERCIWLIIVSIDRSSLNGESQQISLKIPLAAIMWEFFIKDSTPSRTDVGDLEPNCQQRAQLQLELFLNPMQRLAWALRTKEPFSNEAVKFLSLEYIFSKEKGAMNALHIWILRDGFWCVDGTSGHT
jgi:hypothetical protein